MTWELVAQGLVWLGLLAIAVGAIASTRTRWVQARPLGKYVAYSVLAHTVLLALAYGTKLNYQTSGSSDGYSVVRVNLRAADDVGDETEELLTPWEEFPTDSVEAPPMLELPAAASAEKSSAKIEPPPLMNATPPLAAARPDRPVPPLMERAAARTNSDVAPPPIDVTPEIDPDTLVARNTGAESEPPPVDVVEQPPKEASTATTSRANEIGSSTVEPTVPRQFATQQPVPILYRNRTAGDRSLLALRFGGGEDTEAAVKEALQWLADNQSEDGRWDADAFGAGREVRIHGHDRGGAGARADTGVSALAILAFLGSNHSHLEGDYPETVQHGLEFLLRSQGADGSFAGQAEFYAAMYCHGMSLLALSEAYAITGDQRIRPYLERGIEFTVRAQHPTSGGWRYHPGDQGDMSQFGWQVLAIKSAEAGGLAIPEQTRVGMRRFLQNVSSGRNLGLASYRAGERVSPTMTAEAIVCRVFMGDYGDAQGREAAELLRNDLPRTGQENLYYWYYGTMAMFQVQGSDWEVWNEALKRQLLSQQRHGGKLAGSWDPDRQWGQYGGRVFSTALGALCLEVYYRYLPIYKVADSQTRRRK